MSSNPTACLLVIGNEVLSGRTRDANLQYLATRLGEIGIPLREARVIPDVPEVIIAAVNECRARYDHVFTTGGIGPTHDDITADSVARAFGKPIDVDPRAVAMMRERYKPEDLNEARLRMARIPEGATLIDNPISRAPGFRLGNVIVMAGVPSIMQAMLDAVMPTLETGSRMLAETIDSGGIPEGIYAAALGGVAMAHPGVSIGSYPSFTGAGFRNQIVVRSKDPVALAQAVDAVRAALATLSADRAPA